MITKKVAITVLLALVLSTSFTVLNPTLATAPDLQKQKAETMLDIIEDNNMTVTLAFSRLCEQNLTVPDDAQTAYSQGLTHAKEAASLMDQEKFDEACIEAVDAMQKFEEALRLLDAVLPVEPTQTEVTAEQAISLKANITRALQYLERLENLTAKADAAGYNTVALETRLEEVKKHLETATRKLYALNFEGATEEFCVAKILLDELTQLFVRLSNLVTESNTERYLQEAELRVSAAKENIALSATLTPDAKEDAIRALNNSELSLANARDRMEDSNVDEAIEELEEAKKWEEESDRAIAAVNDTSTSVASTDENSIRAKPVASN
ncbi:MAG: hypothetical protein CW691_02205 [Candidatus Bathyarchaeum sp.]|nr:MAG: hypothetical protein CW691_02205 [Candidatus Bathyarchaeum sp.]